MEANHTISTTNLPTLVILIKNICIPFFLIIFIFGLFGNGLTVIILQSKRLQQSSTLIYLSVLAIVDIFYLLTGLLVTIINYTFLFPSDIRHFSLISCILTPYLSYTLAYLSVWLLVSVTVDRAIWVVQPFNAKRVCTTRNAWLTIFSLTIILFSFDSHFFWTMNYNIDSVNASINTTYYKCTPSYFTQTIFPYIDLLLVCVIPCLFMLVANGLIAIQLKRMNNFNKRRQKNRLILNQTSMQQQQQQLQSEIHSTVKNPSNSAPDKLTYDSIINDNFATNMNNIQYPQKRYKSNALKHCVKNSIKGRSNINRSSSLTAMLLAINMFFMISVCPLLVYDVIYFAFNLNTWIEKDEVIRGVLVFGIERFVYVLWYTNFAVHFLLYCLSGPQFRAQVKHWFQSCCHFMNSSCLNNNKSLIKQPVTIRINDYHNSTIQQPLTQNNPSISYPPSTIQSYNDVIQRYQNDHYPQQNHHYSIVQINEEDHQTLKYNSIQSSCIT
ncbi:FMRFamide receptor [Schistosoma japonicum]|uniref:FMRFamide receptor n=2 Tax=Schistosoma japonicum TaxID=6182 RepID=A0A4Z2DUA1_SCHJA|nr:FMRFamide receptor [Schistosoma japonicum]TNN20132.1 FMRFamide receptor [Schistosoma japonicum]